MHRGYTTMCRGRGGDRTTYKEDKEFEEILKKYSKHKIFPPVLPWEMTMGEKYEEILREKRAGLDPKRRL
ncbi:MAG: hypothetical protein KAR39_08785 [Thermoplasmata archaeon]|nr:hypothetical protein [Thermoplasmata archaeon]